MLRGLLFSFAVLLASPCPVAWCDIITVQATDTGWYLDTGFHDPSSTNYIVGFDAGGAFQGEFRNFSLFDLGAIDGEVLSAQLVLENGSASGFDSPDATETFTLFDVTTSATSLVAGGTGLTTTFDDLGSGTIFGQTSVSSTSNGGSVVVNLNAAAISELNNSTGLFSFGGAVTTLSGSTLNDEQIFANSGSSIVTLQLNVAVPEPSATVLGVIGLVSLLSRRNRRS